VLWVVLAINAAMFALEIGAGLAAGSAALQADALDFFGDAANYGISLFVVGMALRYRNCVGQPFRSRRNDPETAEPLRQEVAFMRRRARHPSLTRV
jgi:Co/Zn/Cd efflux system component